MRPRQPLNLLRPKAVRYHSHARILMQIALITTIVVICRASIRQDQQQASGAGGLLKTQAGMADCSPHARRQSSGKTP